MLKNTAWMCIVAGMTSSVVIADDADQKYRDRRPAVAGPVMTGPQAQALLALEGGGGGGGGGTGREVFNAKAISLEAWLPLSAFPNNNGSGNDIWGYVSPSGREYAIVGLEKGFAFVEVTVPSDPKIVAFITGPTSLWHDVTVIGHFAYGASEGGSGIQVMDMSNIDNGVVTLVQNKTQFGHSSTHTILSNPDSGFLYLCGANIANGGLIAVDVNANPANPSFVGNGQGGYTGAWTTRYVHEALIQTYTSGPYAGKEIAFLFTGGPANGNNSTGLDIVDVTNKSNFVQLGSLKYNSIRYSHQGWTTEDKKFLYLNDELDGPNQGVSSSLTRIINIENLSAPFEAGSFSYGGTAIDHNLYVKGNLLFESNYTAGLRVFDITNPVSPKQIAFLDTRPENDNDSFNGSWGNYPYLPSGTILINDIERGLFVVRLGLLNISFEGTIPTTLAPSTPTPVTVKIAEELSTLDPQTVTLHVSVNGSGFSDIPMTDAGAGLFTGNIPGAACLDSIKFYVSAQSTDGRTFTGPQGGSGNAYSAKVQTGQTIVLEDKFEAAGTWTVQNVSLSTGAWERGNPIGTSNQGTQAQPEDDYDSDGVNCYFTDQGSPGGSAGQADVDGGPTHLISPVFSLAGEPSASVGYARWMYGSTGEDVLQTYISNNSGTTWVLVNSTANTGGWEYVTFSVEDYVTPTGTMRLRFTTSDNPNNSVVEAAIDTLTVSTVQCDQCLPDCETDGDLDVFDFLCFQGKFAQQDPYADFEGDGDWDIFDFLAYQNAYSQGCD